jgi:hypothetical protein
MPGPLQGLRVIEMAGLGPGPFCAMLFADMGAEVLRIERPGTPRNPNDILARGRSLLQIDLRAEGAAATVRDAIARADVLIEGFRPGVMERLGLGPADCLALNPRLVYGRMTGWGQHGPLAQAAGHDINYIALSGALHAVGRAGEPPVPPLNYVGDFGGGAMFLAFVKTLGIYPVGSIVKLESGRSGFVIRQNAQDLTRPVLKVFRYNDDMEMSDTEILDLMATPEADTIVARGGEEWARLSHLDTMQMLSTGTPN